MLKALAALFILLTASTSTATRYCTYKVKKGDTLYSIARASKLSLKKLLRINKNRIKKANLLKVGQEILVPCKALEDLAGMCRYKVRKGDSIAKLAAKLGLSVERIAKINNINPKKGLRYGQVLMLPCDNLLDLKIIEKVKLRDVEGILPRDFRLYRVKFMSPVGKAVKVAVVGNRVDLPLSRGERVVAAATGKVIYVERSIHAMGTLVILKHPRNLYTTYAGSNIRWRVREGQKLQRGWILGYATDDTILRFEILKGNRPVRPRRFVEEVR